MQCHQREHTVGHRHVEVHALPGRAPLHERGEDRDHRVHAATGAVGDGRTRDRRTTIAAGWVMARKPVTAR